MDSQSSTSSINSTQYPDADFEHDPYDPDLAADLQSRIFVPPDAFLTTLLRLPKDWRTNTAAQGVIAVIRRDDTFQATAKGYLQALSGTGELDVPPRRLYDGMLERVLELTSADEKRMSHDRSHFLEFAARDEWLDIKQGSQKPKDEDAAEGMDDISSDDDEEESNDVACRRRMSLRCASIARHILSMLRSHSLGLLISPRKAQLLYYDRSVIIITEAFDILDTHDQPTDILIAMLLGFSVIPPNSGVPSFLSQE